MNPHRDHRVEDYEKVMTGDAQLVDVREPDEYATGSLPGAINIPLGDVGERMGELDVARRVVVLCQRGGRSAAAAALLTEAGFEDVINLDGGMAAFDEQG